MRLLSGFIKPFLIALVFVLTGCKAETGELSDAEQRYFCGAENQISDEWFSGFDDGYGTFGSGSSQTSDTVFEGSFACKLDSVQQYGMPLTLTQINEGEFFEASVWVKQPIGQSTIIAGISGKSNYTLNSGDIHQVEDSAGWSKLYLYFGIEAPADTLKLFLFASSETHYFDNFEILRHKQRPAFHDSLTSQTLRIYIPDSAMNVLSGYKKQALQQDIISDDLKEYVNGFILEKGDSIPIEIRLKGDWTDHLENGKTSYRIKTDVAYHGLTTFSIQHPQTRNYMHEWFMHKLCDIEGLLSTTYEFLPVEINGVNQGVYALEEHFDKQLLESRNRREGPIIKMDESGFWALLASGMKDSLGGSYPYYESSMITCFKEGRTEKSKTLSDQFYNSTVLLTLFKNGYPHPEEIFDLKSTARYYALMDLGNIHHSLAWHNRRFYYNPITTKLEIIGFDMIPAIEPFHQPLAISKFQFAKEAGQTDLALDYYLFANPEFRNYYTHYYNYFMSENYLDGVFSILEDEISANEKIMQLEFPNYKLDKQFYYNRAEFGLTWSKLMETKWDDFLQNEKSKTGPMLITPEFKKLETNFIQKEISVNAYLRTIDSVNYIVQLENFHLNDLTVIGYSTKKGEDTIFMLEKPISLKTYEALKPGDYAEFSLSRKPNKIHFTVANIPGAVHSKKIFPWPKPQSSHPRIELEKKFTITNPLYKISGDTLIVEKGHYTLKEIVLVPQKYVVKIEAGVNIDLINEAAIITNNSTYIEGSETDPVTITSSDTSAQGFVVLNATETIMTNVKFTNLGCLLHEGWNLTGAVTIYEGKVRLRNVEIAYNTCEDALNIFRGDFDITQLFIHNTHGDAFDADFCTGGISDSRFENTGNDCIDFSGSVAEISGIIIRNSGDKGISSGEKSTLTVNDIEIDGALTAVASKDGSILNGKNIIAKNCENGAALYKKKPEYPTSWMTLTNCTFENINKPALIERGGILMYHGIPLYGYTQFDIESMYARFEK
ncbi:MAG: CotH kinase family protein [Crocinitomicaceae bacterium]|nr:CotH kinase family protein [Crocinitomicaceae bacterium]